MYDSYQYDGYQYNSFKEYLFLIIILYILHTHMFSVKVIHPPPSTFKFYEGLTRGIPAWDFTKMNWTI